MSDENGNLIPDKAGNKEKEDDDMLEDILNEVLEGADAVEAPVEGAASNGARSRPKSKLKKSEDDQILDDTLDEILGEVTRDGRNQGTRNQSRHQQLERKRRRYPGEHEQESFQNNFDEAGDPEAGAAKSNSNQAGEKPSSGIAALNPGKFFKVLRGKLPNQPELDSDSDDDVEGKYEEFLRVTNTEKREDLDLQESLRRLDYESDFRHLPPPGDADRKSEGALIRNGGEERVNVLREGKNIDGRRRNIMDPSGMLGQGLRRRNNRVVEIDDGLGNHARNQLNYLEGQAENRPAPMELPSLAQNMLENAGEDRAEGGGDILCKLKGSSEEDFFRLLKSGGNNPMQMLQNYKTLTENGQKSPNDLLGEVDVTGGDGDVVMEDRTSDAGIGDSDGAASFQLDSGSSGNGGAAKRKEDQISKFHPAGIVPGGGRNGRDELSQISRLKRIDSGNERGDNAGGSIPMLSGATIPGGKAAGGSTPMVPGATIPGGKAAGGSTPMFPGATIPWGKAAGGSTPMFPGATIPGGKAAGGSTPMFPGAMIPGGKAAGGIIPGSASAQGPMPGDEIDPENASIEDMLNQLNGFEMMRAESNRSPQSSGMNTIIILDCSASMSGEPFQQAQKFVHNFLSELEVIQFEYGIEENVSLITVGEQLSVAQHLTNDYSLVRQQCDCMLTEGPSKLHLALLLPKAVLSQRTLGQHLVRGLCEIHNHIVCPRAILISDGWPTENVESEQSAPVMDELSLLLQNICVDLLRNTVAANMLTMYCYPVGNANKGFLEMLSESTGGRILEESDAERMSRHYLHHNLCGPLRKSNINLADRSRVSEEVKKSIVFSDESDVDEVMKILNQPEPDVDKVDAEMLMELKKNQEHEGKPKLNMKVEHDGQGLLGGMGQLMPGVRSQQPMMMPQIQQHFEGRRGQRPFMPQMGRPVEAEPPNKMLDLEDALKQIDTVFQGQVQQQGGQGLNQPIRPQMGLMQQQLFQQGQGIQPRLPNLIGQQEGLQGQGNPLSLGLFGQQGQGLRGQGDPLGLGLFGQQGQGLRGQGDPFNLGLFGQQGQGIRGQGDPIGLGLFGQHGLFGQQGQEFGGQGQKPEVQDQLDGASEEEKIISMLNRHAEQRLRDRQREGEEESEQPFDLGGFGSEGSLAVMLEGLEGGQEERENRQGVPRPRRRFDEEKEDVNGRKDNNEENKDLDQRANDGDLDVMLDDILGIGEPNEDLNQDRGFRALGLPHRWGPNDNDLGPRLNISNFQRNMESSFRNGRGQSGGGRGVRGQEEDSNEEMEISEDEVERRRGPAGQRDNPPSGYAANRAPMDRAQLGGQGVRRPPLPQGRRGTNSDGKDANEKGFKGRMG